jgi:hypothetical protein
MRLALLGLVALLALGGFPSTARADLVVLQESNGFPGAQGSESARQKVLVAKNDLRVLDERHSWALYVRLNQKVVQEAYAKPAGGGQYVERPLSFYQKIRADREATRAQKVDDYLKEVKKAPQDEAKLKKVLESMGLRADKQTVARLEAFPEETKKVSLVIDGKKRDVKVEHFVVRENEGPAIFDVWMAPELGRPESVFTFYREIGTFSDAVVAKVLELKGFPIEVTAVVDDGNNKQSIHSRVFEIREEAVTPDAYDVPKGWEKTEGKDPALGGGDKQEKCAVCGTEFTPGKELAPGMGEGRMFKSPFGPTLYPVCSDKCRAAKIKELAGK